MKKILIIEDDHIVAGVYRTKLTMEGYQPEVAYDGKSGLEMIRSFRPHLVLLDLILPEMTGVELMKIVRAEPEFAQLPIIVFSNTYLSTMVKEAWKAGATKCFSKSSSSPKQILEAIQSLLAVADAGGAPAATAAGPRVGTIPAASAGPRTGISAQTAPAVKSDSPTDFKQTFPPALQALRTCLQMIIKSNDEPARLHQLDEMSAKVHGLVGAAGLAGMVGIAHMAEALEALLKELYEKPKNLNPSTLRTIAGAVDFLGVLFQHGKPMQYWDHPPAKILVVDDELLSRRAVTHALEKARLSAQEVADPLAALKLLSENPYHLIFLDADMPGMNGFELCAKLRTLPAHAKTPVIFVTGLTDFVARTNSTMAGANDFIAKPFLFIELAVKALGYVLRGRLESAR